VVVDDFDMCRSSFIPYEAYPPLIIDADAVLPMTVAEQRFEAVAGGIRRSSIRSAASMANSLARARR
jgi:hypothetical protein